MRTKPFCNGGTGRSVLVCRVVIGSTGAMSTSDGVLISWLNLGLGFLFSHNCFSRDSLEVFEWLEQSMDLFCFLGGATIELMLNFGWDFLDGLAFSAFPPALNLFWRRRKHPFSNMFVADSWRVQCEPFPGFEPSRATFTKQSLNDNEWRIEFCHRDWLFR